MSLRRHGKRWLLVSLVLSAMGCARVELRLAMGRTQEAFQSLQDRAESKTLAEIPAALDNLEAALRDKRIAGSPDHRDDVRFQRLHQAALESVAESRRQLRATSADDLTALTTPISVSCYTCHESYRPQ